MDISLIDFLLYKTQTNELVAVSFGRWVQAIFYVDHEDLFARFVHPELRNKIVLYDEWKTLKVKDADGNLSEIPCRYIYL